MRAALGAAVMAAMSAGAAATTPPYGSPKLGDDFCFDDDRTLKVARPELTSCADTVVLIGGVCSLHSLGVKVTMANGATEADMLGLFQLCRKSCKLCMPKGHCKDDNEAVDAIRYPNGDGDGSAACKVWVEGDGGCALNGTLTKEAKEAGVITDLELDTIIQACPGSCGRCPLKDPTCNDADDQSMLATMGGSCAGLKAALGGMCSVDSTNALIAIASGLGTAEQLEGIFAFVCPYTCQRCRREGFCQDDDYGVSKLAMGSYTCRQLLGMAGQGGGSCDRAVLIQAVGAFGFDAVFVDQMMGLCAESCGRCAGTTCLDDDAAAAAIGIEGVTNCRGPVASNFGVCVPNDLGSMKEWLPEQIGAFMAACPDACGQCYDPARCGDDSTTLLSLPGATPSCEEAGVMYGGKCTPLDASQPPGLLDVAVNAYCPLMCGHCWQRDPTGEVGKESCKDDDAGMEVVTKTFTNCNSFMQENKGQCGYGEGIEKLVATEAFNHNQAMRLVAELCPLSCGYCVGNVVEPKMEIPSELHFVHRIKAYNSEGSFAGGVYVPHPTMMCNGETVWWLNQTLDFPTGDYVEDAARDIFYILSYNDTWHIVTDGQVEMSLNASDDSFGEDVESYECNVTGDAILKAVEQHGLKNPTQDQTWLNKDMSTSGSPTYLRRKLKKTWVVDTHSRFEVRPCKQESLCMQLNCMEPLDGYTCGDCYIEDAVVVCGDDGDNLRRILVVVVVLLIVFLIIINVGCCTNDNAEESVDGKARTQEWQRQMESITNPVEAFLFRYRGFFVNGLGQLGNVVAQNAKFFFVTMMLIDIMFVCVGVPQITVNTDKDQWVPTGSRISREVQLVDKWEEDTKQFHRIWVMVGPSNKSDAANAWTSQVFTDALQTLVNVETDIFYPNGTVGQKVKGMDFCQSLDNEQLEQVPTLKGKVLPCIAPTALDCFFEGAWEMEDVSNGTERPLENQSTTYNTLGHLYTTAAAQPGANPISLYKGRPSFKSFMDPEAFKDHVSEQSKCEHWVVSATLGRTAWGGAVWDDTKKVNGGYSRLNFAAKQIGVVAQYPPKRTAEFKKWMTPYGEGGIEDALEQWLENVLDAMEDVNDSEDPKFAGYDVTLFMTSSIAQMQKKIGSVGFLNILIGFILMCVLMFVTQFSYTSPHKNHVLVGLAGMIMVLAANLGGVGFIVLCGIEFNHTMIQALPFLALGLGVDDLFLMLHYYNSLEGKTRPTTQVISELYRMSGTSVTLTSCCNSLAFFSGMIIPIPALQDFLASAGVLVIFNYLNMFLAFPALLTYEARKNRKYLEGKEGALQQDVPMMGSQKIHSVQSAVTYGVSPFLQKREVRLGMTAFNLVFFLIMMISLIAIAPFKQEFDLTDLTPKGSYLSEGFRDVQTHLFGQVINHHLTYYDPTGELPDRQKEFFSMFQAARNNSWSLQDNSANAKSWLYWYLHFNNDKSRRKTERWEDAEPPNTPYLIEQQNISRYFVNETYFWAQMQEFRNPANGITTIPAQLCDGFGWKYGVDSLHPGNTIILGTYSYQVNAALLDNPDDWAEHTNDLHDLYESFVGEGRAFPAPSGQYLVMEQFNSLTTYFWTAYSLATVMIFVASMLIPISVRGAVLIAVTSAIAVIEVAALLMLFGLTFSSLIAVALLVGMGITVEFSAHVVAGYEYAEGNRAYRMHVAIQKTFVPVLEGGLSSFLSFVLLAFSPFPYVFKYFFVVFLTVIIVGLLHGCLFLPCLIGTVGSESPQAADVKDTAGEMRPPNQIVIVPAAEPSPNPLVALGRQNNSNNNANSNNNTNNGF
eukprot:TRINITY_DN145_c0_g6_i1.p1 TRINITY_DN145_c0_g6~~TRINITY_DN145_c0_g6_i1.p1  ORF type:complete len:1830 (+),score=549.38 TRINITY_DN145_c0_g6_i1:123-5492(+)